MGKHKDRFAALLDVMEERGKLARTLDLELPDDAQLWQSAKFAVQGVLEGDEPDEDLLEQIREAYDDGRQPTLIDLEKLAGAIGALGIEAFVDNSGGNTMIVSCRPEFPDAAGEMRAAITVGPGITLKDGIFGYVEDFSWGPGDQDRNAEHSVQMPQDRRYRHGEIAVMVAKAHTAEVAHQATKAALEEAHCKVLGIRLDAAAKAGEESLWAKVAEFFPQIKGDMDPLNTVHFSRFVRQMVGVWLDGNQPGGFWTLSEDQQTTIRQIELLKLAHDPEDLVDDVDAAGVMSYAEVKAACEGGPELLDKVKAEYERLMADYRRRARLMHQRQAARMVADYHARGVVGYAEPVGRGANIAERVADGGWAAYDRSNCCTGCRAHVTASCADDCPRNPLTRRQAAMSDMATALHLIARSRCENNTSGSCEDDRDRRPDAPYGADRWCDPCIARAGLQGKNLNECRNCGALDKTDCDCVAWDCALCGVPNAASVKKCGACDTEK